MTTNLDRITHVGSLNDLAPGARNRFVVPTEDYPSHSPFVVLVEDFMEPHANLPAHPHRGIETVTFTIDGVLTHSDHLGNSSVCGPGDVQWMTAGAGIMHGGGPLGGSARALQLWLNLPARLKMSPPSSREQSSAEADLHQAEGVTVRTYGSPRWEAASPAWGVWPLVLSDVNLAPGAQHDMPVEGSSRLFVYVLWGEVDVGLSGMRLSAGDVGWLDPEAAVIGRSLRLLARTEARVMAYASPPIDEPVATGGPFVMNTQDEIREAFAEIRAGTFLNRRS